MIEKQMKKLKNFYDSAVEQLLISKCFRGIVFSFLTLAYGYYLFNASICKDGFWLNIAQPGYLLPFSWCHQMRWGIGLCGWISSLFGLVPTVSGIVGIVAWLFGSVIVVAFINERTMRRDPFFSAIFVVLFMTQPLFSELLLWPGYFAAIGVGILVVALVTVFVALNEVKLSDRSFWWLMAALTFAFSIFETFIPFYIMLVVGGWFLNAIVTRRGPTLQQLNQQIALLVGAIVGKIVVSLGLMYIGRSVFEVDSSLYAGSSVGCEWSRGLMAAAASLSKDVFRDFVFRGLADFSVLCATGSLVLWGWIVFFCARKNRSVVGLFWGLVFISPVFFFPVVQGFIVNYRVMLPMFAFVLPCVIYCCQWLPRRKLVISIILLFSIVFVSKTSTVWSEVCDRFSMDRLHGALIVNEIKRQLKGEEIPIVIVGCLNEGESKCLPRGVAYNLQGSAKPSWIEFKHNHLYVKGGACGMGTLLNASKPNRTELYRFLSWLDAREYMEPDAGLFEEARLLVAANKIVAYPLDGFASRRKLSSGVALVVNLGISQGEAVE